MTLRTRDIAPLGLLKPLRERHGLPTEARGPSRGVLGGALVATGFAAMMLGACGGGQGRANLPEGVDRRETAIEHETCDVESASAERVDANGDGQADIVIVRDGDKEVCRAVDLNLDGIVDRWTYLDAGGKVRRQESDYDRDGRVDEIALFRGGQVVEKHSATTLHNQLDTWHIYEEGKLVKSERDSNGDGVVDQWWEYESPECPLIHSDVNNDGRPDPGATIDYCKETGFEPPVRQAQQQQKPRFDKPVDDVTEVDDRPAGAAEDGPPKDEAPEGGSGEENPMGEPPTEGSSAADESGAGS